MPQDEEVEPSAVAIVCGRILFCVLGLVLIGISATAGLDGVRKDAAIVLVLVGVALVLFGVFLPAKKVGKFALRLPSQLPDDD